MRKFVALLLKSSAIPPGARWVTVHPHGPDTKGQPVLIEPQPDGSAKVIGGAGGKLNHLRLTGVKPEGSYAETIRARAAARREGEKRQRERDKEAGLQESKAKAHERLTEQTRAANREFVASVAKLMGWETADYTFDASPHGDKPEHVVNKMAQKFEADMVKRAMAAVKLNRERIMADHAARAEASLGEVPLQSQDPNVLSVQDLDPVRTEPLGLGFAPDYKGRAAEKGADEAAVAEEAAEIKPPMTDGQRKAAIARGETAQMVAEGMETLRDPENLEAIKPQLVDAKQAVELLKMEKKLKLALKDARAERKRINTSSVEPKAYVLEVDDTKVDAKVAEDVANDLRTISTRAFLSEVRKTAKDPAATLGQYVGAGAYNSVNALALAAGGAALVDRSVVDVLGVAGAAQVLARRLQTDLTPEEFEQVAAGMQDYHLHHYVEASAEAIGRARELQSQAAEMELGEAETGADLATMQEINKRRASAIAESQKVLGQALGEMEANAALVYALGRGKSDKPFEVSLGDTTVESAIQQVRAIGLQRGEYRLETVAGNRVLTVSPEGLDRLAMPVNRADLEQVRRNLDIVQGAHDEDGWLPLGFADRPDLDLQPKPGAAPSLAVPFAPGSDLRADVEAYIGGRAADGDAPSAILADLQSAQFLTKVDGRVPEYRAVLDELAPLQDAAGNLHQADALRPAFEAMADKFVSERYGADRSPLHRQTIPVDDVSIDALHRALADDPAGVAAFKPVGEMTPQDQGALREVFSKRVAKESQDVTDARHELDTLGSQEPERETADMFGDSVINPEWTSWNARRDELKAKVNAAAATWPKYVAAMGGPANAYAAMQDVVRSGVMQSFATAYNTLRPDAPLKVGRASIRENLNHLDFVDPKARAAREAKHAEMVDGLRNRAQGRYAAGSVRDKLDAAREEEAGLQAAQMGFFADEPAAAAEAPLGGDERWTIGQAAERQIAALMPQVGQNFKPGQPVRLGRPTMSGGKNVARQRLIKLIEANERVIASFGTGSGKTAIGLGAYTHLQQQGKVKRGLFLAPSIAQGNFGGDALKYLKPGQFKWHCEPGANRESRIAAYKDPANHFAVMTHQSFRDDMIHLGAQHAGVSEEEMVGRVKAMSREERRAWADSICQREGFDFDYMNVDEGHNLLDREGKESSTMAEVTDAFTDRAKYYVNASADPIKNDVSEAFSLLQKMDPARYTDAAAFKRRYGVDTLAAKDSLRRELARFQYPSKIDPDITATRREIKSTLSAPQKRAMADLDNHVASARIARMEGRVDLDALKALSPSSFDGVDESEHEAIGRALQADVGLLKQTAVRRILDAHPESGKLDDVERIAGERKGQQGIVFAHGLAAVESLKARLAKAGYRVGTISGKDSAKEKAKRIGEFKPPKGDPSIDIMVCSDAGATGANLQSGRWLVNYDTPDTAMTHAQRNGRINRVGQKNDVDLIDLVSDHPEEAKRRDRLTKKYALREALTTPLESLDDTGIAYFLKQRQIAKDHGA